MHRLVNLCLPEKKLGAVRKLRYRPGLPLKKVFDQKSFHLGEKLGGKNFGPHTHLLGIRDSKNKSSYGIELRKQTKRWMESSRFLSLNLARRQ